MKWMLIFLISSLALVDFATAQSRSDQKPTKKTVINFDDELVEGDVTKPELSYLLQKKQFNFGRLIKLRENFLPEMRRTAEDVERGK
jgi:hypothetical protein